MRHAKVAVTVLAVVCMGAPALGVGYVELVSQTNVEAGGTGDRTWSHTISGQTAYIAVNGFSSQGKAPNITKVDTLGGVQAASVLYTAAQWGASSLNAGHGFGISGTDLMWTDTSTDAIWKGALDGSGISSYVSKAQIQAFTGGSNASSGNGNTVAPSGEFVWFESTSDSLLITTGPGTMATLADEPTLMALHGQVDGSATIVSGMAFDASGTMYWGDADDTAGTGMRSGGLYHRTSGGTLGTTLTAAEIAVVSGAPGDRVGFGDLFLAPDGLIYFYESREDNIMRFDPADAANSLEIYVSEAELLAGDMGSDNVVNLDWYDGNLTFHTFQVGGAASPLFVVPEPAALSLLALGGLALLRRRR